MNYRMSGLAIAALGFVLAPAVCAQQYNSPPSGSSADTISANLATPAPKPARPARGGSSPSGAEFPRLEAFGGFTFVQFHPVPGLTGNLYGGNFAIDYNVNRWIGLVADGSLTHLENAGR